MDRTCPKCSKIFTKPCFLKRHMGRKTSCEPAAAAAEMVEADRQRKPYDCKHCGKHFASQPSMLRHVRQTCKLAAPSAVSDEPGGGTLQRQLIEQTAKVDTMRGELAEQKQQIAELTALLKQQMSLAPGGRAPEAITINSAQTSVQTVVLGPQINIFGQEKTDYITTAAIQQLASESEVQERPDLLALRLCGLIYANNEHPENRTAYIPNKKEPYALVYTGEPQKPWQWQPTPQVMTRMVKRSGEELHSKVDLHDVKLLQEMASELDTIGRARMDALYNAAQLAKELKPDLLALLLNNKPGRGEAGDAGPGEIRRA